MKSVASFFSINHSLLTALGVGHPSLTAVVEAANKSGFACKLTGAGGGGCAIALLSSDAKDDVNLMQLQRELDRLGRSSFISKVGGVGVQWHTSSSLFS